MPPRRPEYAAMMQTTAGPAVPVATSSAAPPRADAGRLRIIIGVTGHRDLPVDDEDALRAAIGAIFERFEATYPATPLLALTPLAVGADRIFAREALARGIPFRVPLPLPLDEYLKDFNAAERAEFEDLVQKADAPPYDVGFVDDNDAGNVSEPARRAKQYALVGAHLARASHVLIALWDGKPTGKNGGTAEVVDFRLRGIPPEYLDFRPTLLDAPERGPVYHIPVERSGDRAPAFPQFALRVITRDGQLAGPEADPFATIYTRIEDFNEDAARAKPVVTCASEVESLARVASTLAGIYQKKTNASLLTIFGGAFLAASFLALYGHLAADQHWLIVPYTICIVWALVTYERAARGRFQDRFQDYRAMEVGLNVQRVWDQAGVDASVADYYIRRQRSELDWIRVAIRSARRLDRAEPPPDAGEGIVAVREFVLGQLEYFTRAEKFNFDRAERYERSAKFWFWAGLCFSLAGVVGLGATLFFHGTALASLDRLHGFVIFTIAMFTLAAALLQEYPRRRAFREQARRYRMMRGIYDRAREALEETDDAPIAARHRRAQDVILEIGREALLENGDWVLLHRQLPLEIPAV